MDIRSPISQQVSDLLVQKTFFAKTEFA